MGIIINAEEKSTVGKNYVPIANLAQLSPLRKLCLIILLYIEESCQTVTTMLPIIDVLRNFTESFVDRK